MTLLIYLLLSCSLFQHVHPQNVLTCPNFEDGKTVELNLQIDNSTFTPCLAITTVYCYFTTMAQRLFDVCSQPIKVCNRKPNFQNCYCSSVKGSVLNFVLSFRPNVSRYSLGSFKCSLDCVILPGSGKTPATVISDASCRDIDIA